MNPDVDLAFDLIKALRSVGQQMKGPVVGVPLLALFVKTGRKGTIGMDQLERAAQILHDLGLGVRATMRTAKGAVPQLDLTRNGYDASDDAVRIALYPTAS